MTCHYVIGSTKKKKKKKGLLIDVLWLSFIVVCSCFPSPWSNNILASSLPPKGGLQGSLRERGSF